MKRWRVCSEMDGYFHSSAEIKTRWKLLWGKTKFNLLGIHFHVNLDQIQRIKYSEKYIKSNP